MNKRLTWLPFLSEDVPSTLTTPEQIARFELDQALPRLAPGQTAELNVVDSMEEGYTIHQYGDAFSIIGGKTGVLYGAYALLMNLSAGHPLPEGQQQPRYGMRMLNCWDNASGDIERGYSGRSLFFENNKFDYDPKRMRQLGRMLASVGLNVMCINNVNVRHPADQLIESWLPELAELAAIFRPFGVKLMVSIDYSAPMRHGIPTADPLDKFVQGWWARQAEIVYQAVPDLAGFLVKADSEHRPGPFTYGRNHAEGANMLARALKPFGGKLVWRCFVYNCMQDWRDTTTDRPKAAYDHYAYLDGQFEDNVILQVKNGPFDFQVREPVSPLLYAMPSTNLAIEFQLAQEYTGQQVDIYAMPPMWREVYDDMPADKVMAIAAVTNLGRDENYTGHPFAAVNLFGYGLFAWNPDLQPEKIIRLWARLTYCMDQLSEDALVELLMNSRRTYEKYTAPLGLCWMISPNHHYGPSPSGYEYQAWGTYHKADRDAVGIDRTASGTGYLLQYPEKFQQLYGTPESCPDLLKLFFHRLRYDYVMSDGRTMIQRIYDDHFEGLEETRAMAETLKALPLPEVDKREALERMDRQLVNAREWCDIVNTFFRRYSGAEDAHGRTIYR
ncbi:MAG: alpha-glucuronidase [Clostridiales bacterium]|nr:alpha-glucuronidase [Clostridiales bacterium]